MAIADILVTPARMYYAPVGEADPADTLAVEADWGGNWEYIGDTTEPLNMASSVETFEVDIQQSTVPVKQSITSQEITLSTSVAEFTTDLLKLLYGGTVTDTAAATGTPGTSELKAGVRTAPDQYKWGFEGIYVTDQNDRLPVRLFFHIGTITQSGDIVFDKAGVAAVPIQVQVLADTAQAAGEELMRVLIVNAPALP